MSLPVVLCNMNQQVKPLGRLDYIGCAIFLVGFLCETIADFQKLYFKQRNPDRWCDWGLWRYSRRKCFLKNTFKGYTQRVQIPITLENCWYGMESMPLLGMA